MIDTHTHRDHRREAAMATNQSNGRGYSIADEPSLWLRALVEICRPRSLFLFAVIGVVVALWWL